MSKLKGFGLVARIAASLLLVLMGGLASARADTMACTGDAGYCNLGSTGNYGSVTATGLGTNTVDLFFNLSVGTIADPTDASVVFDITNTGTGSITGASVLNNANTSDYFGWGTAHATGSYQIDAQDGNAAFGTFTGGASCNNGSGCGTEVEIQITGSSGAKLELGTTGGYFAAIDTQLQGSCAWYWGGQCQSYNYYDGAVADSLTATPLPAAFPLFGSVIAAGGLIGFRKRRRSSGTQTA